MQCFKCQKFGHPARYCSNAIRCLRCSQDHSVKECTFAKENAKCSKCGAAHATVYRGCPEYQHKLAEVSKNKNEDKFSAVANKLHSQAKTDLTLSTDKIAVLVAEVFSRIRTVLKTISYSDIKKIVSNSSSRIFNEKIDGQRIHDSKQLLLFRFKQTICQTAKTFCKMDKLKTLQWNCRGLNNKISDLIWFSTEEIDVNCLNEVKSGEKEPPQQLHRCNRNLQQRSSWLCYLSEEQHYYQANRTSRKRNW